MGAPRTSALRNFMARIYKNLPMSQRVQMSKALADFDNMESFHSLNTSTDILARRPDTFELRQYPSADSINRSILDDYTYETFGTRFTTTPQVYGGLVQWERPSDPRIQFFELNISNDPAFTTYETQQTQDLSFQVTGVRRTKYVRVRGVRKDGTTTTWSDTAWFIPKVIDLRIHTLPYGPFAPFSYSYMQVSNIYGTYIPIDYSPMLAYTPNNPRSTSLIFGTITCSPYLDIGAGDPGVSMFKLDLQINGRNVKTFFPGASDNAVNYAYPNSPCFTVGPMIVDHASYYTPGTNIGLAIQWRLSIIYALKPCFCQAWVSGLNAIEFGI